MRALIVNGIKGKAHRPILSDYGFRVAIPEKITTDCLEDNDGDKLDSVLCAVQAAWAWKTGTFGIPSLNLTVLQKKVELEGWIVDPFMLEMLSTRCNESGLVAKKPPRL
jgi:hypothetical protein